MLKVCSVCKVNGSERNGHDMAMLANYITQTSQSLCDVIKPCLDCIFMNKENISYWFCYYIFYFLDKRTKFVQFWCTQTLSKQKVAYQQVTSPTQQEHMPCIHSWQASMTLNHRGTDDKTIWWTDMSKFIYCIVTSFTWRRSLSLRHKSTLGTISFCTGIWHGIQIFYRLVYI